MWTISLFTKKKCRCYSLGFDTARKCGSINLGCDLGRAEMTIVNACTSQCHRNTQWPTAKSGQRGSGQEYSVTGFPARTHEFCLFHTTAQHQIWSRQAPEEVYHRGSPDPRQQHSYLIFCSYNSPTPAPQSPQYQNQVKIPQKESYRQISLMNIDTKNAQQKIIREYYEQL